MTCTSNTLGEIGRGFAIALMLIFFLSPWAHALAAGTVLEVEGEVESVVAPSSNWQATRVDTVLVNGDQIKTSEGRSTLLLQDESMLKLNRNTYLRMESVPSAFQQQQSSQSGVNRVIKSLYRLFSGDAWLRNNNLNVDIEVQTPTVTASLRGTELHIEVVSEELVNITVLEGSVFASNASGQIEASAGELIIAQLGQPPRKQTLLSPQDSVQWTVRIPGLVESGDWLGAGSPTSENQEFGAFFNALSSFDISGASQQLAEFSTLSDERRELLQGLVSLMAGEHSEAYEQFERAYASDQTNAIARRGLTVTALLLNQKMEAAKFAEAGITGGSATATDWLLLSQVQRANFQLPEAEASAQQALVLEPENIVAMNTMATLQFADDRLEAAGETIEQALSIDPKDSLNHSLHGFILLSQREHSRAQESFNKAIALDAGNSEAYLGLSLLLQRLGEPERARLALANAIALEPQRSLFLSYWAKRLYAERRFNKALTVLDSAQRLDPQDPTPHYYRALILRDQFFAGEAINSLEKAIELNGQRAVFRSRLLLDQDMAVRNVDLATIYGALGMNQIATQKAIASTLDDYRNFSAHLFLSSALTSAGRDFPAGSEILVTGLMLPANANALSSVNDYTMFFEGPELDSNLQVTLGDDSSRSLAASLAGVAPEQDLAYGITASSSETDGFRGDNGGQFDAAAATVKWQPSERDSFRARVSSSELQQRGGFFRRFEIDQPSSDEIVNIDDDLLDFGYRRKLTHRSDLLLNLVYRKTDSQGSLSNLDESQITDLNFLIEEETRNTRETIQIQSQYSLKTDQRQWFAGAIHLSGDTEADLNQRTTLVDDQRQPLTVTQDIQEVLDAADLQVSSLFDELREVDFTSVYVDHSWQSSDKLMIQGGLYYEDFDDEITSESKLNPRLGAVWKPTSRDTFRIAGFRYLLPQVQARLHPTHVAGVFITRNTEEGALVEEFNLVWEREFDGGIFRSNLFDLDREVRERRAGSDLSVQRSSLRGLNLGFDQQLGLRMGISSSVGWSEIRDDFSALQSARDELNGAVTVTYLSPSRVGFSITQIHRRIDFFESSRRAEIINLTDLSIAYVFRDRRGSASFSVTNLFDNEFNWITDAFVLAGRAPARQISATFNWNF